MRQGFFKPVTVIFTLTAGLIVYFVLTFEKPPVGEIDKARTAVSEAESLHASIYAGIIFRNSKAYYDSAMSVWQKENNKLFFLRDFSEVTKFARLSEELAITASEKTRSALTNITELLSGQIKRLENEIELYNTYYSTVPLEEEQRRKLNRGTLLFKEGMLAFERQNYHAALDKVDSAEVLIISVTRYSRQTLEEYFEDYHLWLQSYDRLIASSKRNNSTCIIVDKTGRICNVYKNGELSAAYEVELGPNWIGHKRYQGDMSTPEGLYEIVSKKSGSGTSYHKALLLNYPNEDDKKRFQTNKKNGIIDSNAMIGGMIEIHGHGGKGSDWTNGCVALSNRDMDSLYPLIPAGTKVLIIGSLKPLEEITDILENE